VSFSRFALGRARSPVADGRLPTLEIRVVAVHQGELARRERVVRRAGRLLTDAHPLAERSTIAS